VIRLSDRLRHVPGWVLDAVLVHEIAHLVHPDHGADFTELAQRHPRQRDASRYLEGYQLGLEMSASLGTVSEHDGEPPIDELPDEAPPTTLF